MIALGLLAAYYAISGFLRVRKYKIATDREDKIYDAAFNLGAGSGLAIALIIIEVFL